MRIHLLTLILAANVIAQTPIPPTPPGQRTVRLHFVPPPMEGTISLGIFDAGRKLVRVLHREDAISDFALEHDGLETTWDGNDDAGNALPSGKYGARGFVVGEIKIEGVAYFFNDWVTDATSPHLARVSRIAIEGGSLKLSATTAGDHAIDASYNLSAEKLTALQPNESPVQPQEIAPLKTSQDTTRLSVSTPGRNATLWQIIRLANGGADVEQVPANLDPGKGTILRKLSIPPNEPQPVGIAASLTEDRIFLLEQNSTLQRVRSLTLIATKPDRSDRQQSVSDWRVDFEKKIVGHENFVLVDGKPALSDGTAPNELQKLSQPLRRNPLERDEPGKVELATGFDADGSYLKTGDGLPLRTVGDTPNLLRALLARADGTAIDFFQDDGAVVEQYRISQLDQMMAFDCGDFELKPAK